MKSKFINAFMEVAKTFANLSSAQRLKVGAIVVKDDRIISIGYNGMPSGWDNVCEEWDGEDEWGNTILKSKPEVLHAEANALTKLASSHESGKDAILFCTHAPCIDCAKLIYQTGITAVYYENEYRSTQGIEFLKKSGVVIRHRKP